MTIWLLLNKTLRIRFHNREYFNKQENHVLHKIKIDRLIRSYSNNIKNNASPIRK